MKRYKLTTAVIAFIAAFALLLPATVSSARGAGGSGYLFIARAPDLGNFVFVDVRIDGAKAGSILWGQNYGRAVPAGRHVIWVQLGPAQYSYSPSSITLDVRPGRTYRFQAKKQGGYLVLASF